MLTCQPMVTDPAPVVLRLDSKERSITTLKKTGYCNFPYSALASFQDGDVGVSVFPEREEIFVGGERPHAGGIGIRSLRGSRLQCIGTSHAQMRQRSRPAVPDDPAVVENLLKLGGSGTALSGCQVRLSAYIHMVEAGDIEDGPNLPQLDRGISLELVKG